jgi:hypothetical protein
MAVRREDGRRAVVIASALDDAPADVRAEGAERKPGALAAVGAFSHIPPVHCSAVQS